MTIENCVVIKYTEETVDMEPDTERDNMIKMLAENNQICFKSQQKWEADLTQEEKFQIGLNLFTENKLHFLLKFGKYLQNEQLDYFQTIIGNEPNNEELTVLLKDLSKKVSEAHNTIVKNRRYQAMVQMIGDNTYFSEIEMMKRNPLLYNQLVGQYLTSDEVDERDRFAENGMGLVNILMEGIERDKAEETRKKQEEVENSQTEVEETIPKPSTSHWGEIGEKRIQQNAFNNRGRKKVTKITPEEQNLLKEEFITTMYHSFLEGKDEDFDYDNVDNNNFYDNVEEMENDEEEKYFNSEPEVISHIENDSSEDELDVFMKTLN